MTAASSRSGFPSLAMRARGMLAHHYRRAHAALAPALHWPGDLYAGLYVGNRLNELHHRLGCSAGVQAALVPRRLMVDQRLMQQPYTVRVADIRWGGRPPGGAERVAEGRGRGFIHAGDWDVADKQPIADYLAGYVYSKTVLQIYRDGLPYTASDQFKEMLAAVRSGADDWRTRGCRNEADVHAHFADMDRTYRAIAAHGYRSQRDLGSARWYDEIKLFIDRNGELHKQQGAGHHRLAMARLLHIETIPVVVIGVHRSWAMRAQGEFRLDIISAIDAKIRRDIASR